jgi:hypothetical protein
MDNVVTLYHGGSVEEDEFGNVRFVGMQRVPLMCDDRPMFSELGGSARDVLHCNSNEDGISIEGGYFTMVKQVVYLGGWYQLHQRLNGTNMSELS